MRKKRLTGLVMAAAVFLLAGCGSSKEYSTSAGAAYDTVAAVQEAPAEAAAATEEYLYDTGYGDIEFETAAQEGVAEEGGDLATEVKEEAGEVSQTGRKLITTMNLSAETEYFDELMGNLERQITELGGYIESSDQWNGRRDDYGNRLENRNASLTVRIPAEKLEGFLSLMEESSNITSKSKSVEDVTLAYVDLESHKKALLAEQERLMELLEMAETVEDLITVEDKLANVRYQLESMESQLRTYDNQINYSTVYLNIQEVKRLTPVEEPGVWGKIKNGFSENVYAVGMDIQNFFIDIIISIPYILVWLVILAAVFLIVFFLAKYEKKKKAKRLLKRQRLSESVPAAQDSAQTEGKLPAFNKAWKKKKGPEPETGQEENKEKQEEEEKEEKDDGAK